MKKARLFLAGLLGLSLVALNSCDETETASPLSVDLLQKAKVKGYVYADLDLVNAGLEAAPQGTKVLVQIAYSDLKSDANGYWQDTVSVGADGTFETEVPVVDWGTEVNFAPVTFEYEQQQTYDSYQQKIKKVFYGYEDSWDLYPDDFEVVELYYDYSSLDGIVKLAKIEGKLTAELDNTNGEVEDGPSGVELTFYGTNWSKKVTTGSNGSFSIEVPEYTNVYVSFEFQANKTTGGGTDPYIYKVTGKNLGSFSSVLTDYEIYAGTGTPVAK